MKNNFECRRCFHKAVCQYYLSGIRITECYNYGEGCMCRMCRYWYENKAAYEEFGFVMGQCELYKRTKRATDFCSEGVNKYLK